VKTKFFISLFIITILFGCAGVSLVDVPLVWKPTSDLHDTSAITLTGLYAQQFKVMPFVDVRDNKKEIAKNIQSSSEKIITTRDNVGEWSSNRFKAIFKELGLKVVDDSASVIIKGEVVQYYVVEDNLYKAHVGVRLTVENASGKILWQGLMYGNSKRFGRSYKLENYYETLSDAYLDAVQELLKNQEFRSALQVQ
jgi:hypothetical protein